MKIKQLDASGLVPYARNAKWHSEQQIQAIAKSITEFGFNNPVLVDVEGGIIAGHARVLAAEKLGLRAIPCIRLSHLTPNQKKAYILADNRLTEMGSGWDSELLETELKDIDFGELGNFGVEDFGFDILLQDAPAPTNTETRPDVNPDIDDKVYTDDELEKAADKTSEITDKVRKQISVMCPECGAEFLIDE